MIRYAALKKKPKGKGLNRWENKQLMKEGDLAEAQWGASKDATFEKPEKAESVVETSRRHRCRYWLGKELPKAARALDRRSPVGSLTSVWDAPFQWRWWCEKVFYRPGKKLSWRYARSSVSLDPYSHLCLETRVCSDISVAHMLYFGFCFALFWEGNGTRSRNSSIINLPSILLLTSQKH